MDVSERILNVLIFEEPYDKIVEECRDIPEPIVADELKILIARDKVRAITDLSTGNKANSIYDSHKLTDYSFRITAKGLDILSGDER